MLSRLNDTITNPIVQHCQYGHPARRDSLCCSVGVLFMSKVVWLPIKGYEGVYEVSNMGNVRSIERMAFRKNGKQNGMVRSKILKPLSDQYGYNRVRLYSNFKWKQFRIHRLVMAAFIGDSELTVDHINGEKKDNRLSNLRYLTQRENNTEARKKMKSTSDYIGVSFCKSTGKWRSVISINGKYMSLGRYETEAEASEKYQEKLMSINT